MEVIGFIIRMKNDINWNLEWQYKVAVPERQDPMLVLKFIWMEKNIGIALDQLVPGYGSIPLSPYYFWPRKDAWEELRAKLEEKEWISQKQMIILLNQATDIINLWQQGGGSLSTWVPHSLPSLFVQPCKLVFYWCFSTPYLLLMLKSHGTWPFRSVSVQSVLRYGFVHGNDRVIYWSSWAEQFGHGVEWLLMDRFH